MTKIEGRSYSPRGGDTRLYDWGRALSLANRLARASGRRYSVRRDSAPEFVSPLWLVQEAGLHEAGRRRVARTVGAK